jgi:hypothetical protein
MDRAWEGGRKGGGESTEGTYRKRRSTRGEYEQCRGRCDQHHIFTITTHCNNARPPTLFAFPPPSFPPSCPPPPPPSFPPTLPPFSTHLCHLRIIVKRLAHTHEDHP